MAADERVLRVVIAEDAVLLRAGQVRLLRDAGFDVVGEAGDGEELLRKVRAHRPDVVVIGVPVAPAGADEGLGTACRIRAELPDVGLLLLSEEVDVARAAELVERGAEGVGYLLRDRVAEVAHFVDAVRQVACRRSVFDPEVVAQLLGARRATPLDGLGERERVVLGHMADGASNRAIARRMFLSERAVERSVTAILDTLEISHGRDAHRRVLAVLAYLGES